MKKKTRRREKKAATGRRSVSGTQLATENVTYIGWTVAIFIVAFASRLIYLSQIQSIPLFYNLAGDARTYYEWAQRIAAGDWLGQGVFYQAPLYPYFLGLLQVFVGHDLWSIRLTQIVLGSFSCVLIALIGRALFSRASGIVSGLLLALYAPALFFDALIEKSTLDVFLLSLLLLMLSTEGEKQQWSIWLATGFVLGLLGLSRENALILTIVIPLWIWIYFHEQPVSIRAQWLGLFTAGLLSALLPVGVRNLAVGGEFKLTTSQFGANFFIGNNPSADGTYASVRNQIGAPQLEGSDAARLAERSLGRPLTPGQVSSYWFQQSWNYIRSKPMDWLELLAKKWFLVWNFREIEDSDDFYIYQRWSSLLRFLGSFSHFGTLAPLAAMGVFLTLADWRRLWLLYAVIFSLALSVAVFYVFGRYRFPLVPLLVLFAGAGLVKAANFYNERNWKPLLPSFLFLLAAGVIVNWPMNGVRGPGAAGYNNLANAYYKQGKLREAIESARQAIEIDADYGVAYYNLGNFYAAQGNFDVAQANFEETVRLYPNHAEARSNLGFLLVQKGEVDAGIHHFRKAIEINPTTGKTYLNLGAALVQQGRLEQAIQPLNKAVELDPESDKSHFYLGTIYASQRRYNEAAKHFAEAIRIQANFPEAHENLARVLSLQGKKQEALRHFQEALRLTKQKHGASGLQ
jgi:tetratricopeptide (TPR) repeat protein